MGGLSAVQRDRAVGVLLTTAAGDALGAPYEFGPPLTPATPVAMGGGGGWDAGEWTDDTAMAVAIAESAADGADLTATTTFDRVVRRWVEWSRGAKDVGIQTRQVLAAADPARPAGSVRDAAADLHRRTGRTAGNGSLMRTAPIAVALLDDEDGLVSAATAVSGLTHADPEAGEACVLWCLAIRHAVLAGELDVRVGLAALPVERARLWRERIEVAERSAPRDFSNNGWVVEALQAAWSAIATTPVPPGEPAERRFRSDHLRLALENAVRGGRDADTVAAIAGGLLGAAYGAAAVPWHWRRVLHGWPGLGARDLVALGERILRRGEADPYDFGYADWRRVGVVGPHPSDPGLLLGGVAGLVALPAGVDAVVSLCRVQPPSGVDVDVDVVVESRLIDRPGDNADVDFVLADAVDAIESLRAEGRTVYLHCVAAQSRTPAVAALYAMRRTGVDADAALAEVRRVLPRARPNPELDAALRRA